MGGGVAVVTGSKVAVVRCDDAVGLALGNISALPLPDARTAGIGQHSAAHLQDDVSMRVAVSSSVSMRD